MKTWLTMIGTALLLAPACASACDCDIPPLKVALQRSAAIFAGKVVRIEPGAANHVRVTVSGSRWWKGAMAETVVVSTPSSGDSCGYAFKAGEEYLIYAQRLPGETELSTNICTRTRPLKGAGEELEALTAALTALANGLNLTVAPADRVRVRIEYAGLVEEAMPRFRLTANLPAERDAPISGEVMARLFEWVAQECAEDEARRQRVPTPAAGTPDAPGYAFRFAIEGGVSVEVPLSRRASSDVLRRLQRELEQSKTPPAETIRLLAEAVRGLR